MPDLILYSYWRSSAAYRVRIALQLKGLDYELRYLNLRDATAEQKKAYRQFNPQGLVPALQHQGRMYTQSLAIIEYLDTCFPDVPLLPADLQACAYVRAIAQLIACDIHPLNNLRVLRYLQETLCHSEQIVENWYGHWVAEGFAALESLLAAGLYANEFCCTNQPTLADVCLIPQVYNALRYRCDLQAYPIIKRIYANCMQLAAFQQAAPENQPDRV